MSNTVEARTPIEKAAERYRLLTVVPVFVATLALAWGNVSLERTLLVRSIAAGFILLMLMIQVGGGVHGLLRRAAPGRAERSSSRGRMSLWMSTVSGLAATALTAGVWTVFANAHPAVVVVFAPALAALSLIAAVMLLIGLMGADYPDAAREWTARIGSILGIVTTAWIAIFGLAVFGPWAVSWLLGNFHTLGVTAIGAWVLTTAAGVVAGKSEKTNGSGGRGTTRVLEILTGLAPTVFLVGYMIAIATGVHVAMARLDPGALVQPQASSAPARTLYDVNVTTPEGAGVEVRVNAAEDSWLRGSIATSGVFAVVIRPRSTLMDDTVGDAAESGLLWLDSPRLADGPAVRVRVVTAIASSRININEFSLHHFYKNRLVRCYLGASKSRRRGSRTH